MARLEKKQLRLPVGDEWNNLPKSIDEARTKGLNRFMKDGEMYELRRSNTDAYPQGKSERVSSRKDNRGTAKRNQSEKIASPDSKVRKATNQYMTELSAKGRVGHHGMGGVTKYAEGKQAFIDKQAKLGISAKVAGKDWDIRSGLPEGGHSKANIYDMALDDHSKLHDVTEREYLNKIKNAGKKTDKIFNSIKQSTQKVTNLSGIQAFLKQNNATFTPRKGNGIKINGETNGHTNGKTNGKVTNGESTKVPTNGKTNGHKNGATNGRGKFISSLTKKTKNLRGLSGVALDTNFMDDLVQQKPSTIYKSPRDTFFAPIPTRNGDGDLETNFLPIDKV